MIKVSHLNFFDFELFHIDFFDFRFFKFRFSFSSSMIIQYYWWIIQCNERTTTQIGAGVLGYEQDFTLNFLEFKLRIRIRSPPSLSTIQYYWWIAMSGLLLRVAMCVPMYLFEHHLACDLVYLSTPWRVHFLIACFILHMISSRFRWNQLSINILGLHLGPNLVLN